MLSVDVSCRGKIHPSRLWWRILEALILRIYRDMRKLLTLAVSVALLLTNVPRLIETKEQAATLRQAVVAFLERDDARAVWERMCDAGYGRQSELSCLWLYLSTGGEQGGIPCSSLQPESLAIYAYGFGLLAEEAQAIDYAVFSYQFSLDLSPSRRVGERLTRLLRREDREVEAVAVWRRLAANLSPEEPDHWWALGQAAELQEDWQLSSWAYGQGGELETEAYPYFWMRQGDILQRIQRWKGAEQAYYRALSVNSYSYAPYLSLGRAHFEQNQQAQAMRWLGQAFLIRSDYVWTNYHLAQVLHRAGDEEVAVDFLARALSLHPGEPWHWAVQMGDWRLALGDRHDALEAYRQALIWQPEEILIQERIARLSTD